MQQFLFVFRAGVYSRRGEESGSEEVRGPGRGPLGGVREAGGRPGDGQTNILDHQAVRTIVTRMGYLGAALWVAEHRHEYSEGLFCGFVAAE